MTPQFATYVDPIFEYVLALLERIEENADVNPTVEKENIRELISRADANLGKSEEWQLARYALACFADEVLIASEWPHREWWMNNCLEFELCASNVRATQFYEKSSEAMKLAVRDALEVYFLAVILGFRGVYDSPDRANFVAAYGFPESLAAWVRQTASGLSIRRNPDPTPALEKRGAEALRGRQWLVSALLLLLAMIGIVLPTLFWAWTTPGSGLSKFLAR